MACNGLIGIGGGTMISPPSSDRYFDLSMVEIAVFDRECYQVILDLTMLIGMAQVSENILSIVRINTLAMRSLGKRPNKEYFIPLFILVHFQTPLPYKPPERSRLIVIEIEDLISSGCGYCMVEYALWKNKLYKKVKR